MEVVATKSKLSFFSKGWEKTPDGIKKKLLNMNFNDRQYFFAGQLYDWLRQEKSFEAVTIGDDLASMLYFDDKTNLSELMCSDKFVIGECPTHREWVWTTSKDQVEAIIIENVTVFDLTIPTLRIVNSAMAPGLSGLGGKIPILKID